MINFARILLILLITGVTYAQAEGNTIEVEIKNIDNSDGQILIGLYDSEGAWLKEHAQGAFGKIIDGKSHVTFENVADGTYAISVFHDEDNDGELDTNFFGIPSDQQDLDHQNGKTQSLK